MDYEVRPSGFFPEYDVMFHDALDRLHQERRYGAACDLAFGRGQARGRDLVPERPSGHEPVAEGRAQEE
ncbi:hypothetical protein [Bradyrhizobium aeschynomenes]|uniref:hypothetical protein n=1 Tax=Bradyrhizobium aeschynomenes TaxID=2734909 RepID=UPI003D316812